MNKSRAQLHKERKQLKATYGALYAELLRLFRLADPIHIGSSAPRDEYEPEVSTVLPRLTQCRSASDVQKVLHEEFVRWFDAGLAGSLESYAQLAADTWRAYVATRRDA